MSDKIQIVTVQLPQRIQIATVRLPQPIQVATVQTGTRGPRGIQGPPGTANVLVGTGSPPDPSGVPDGAIYYQYTP